MVLNAWYAKSRAPVLSGRARIETVDDMVLLHESPERPSCQGGRGLKRHQQARHERVRDERPSCQGGRGLKLEILVFKPLRKGAPVLSGRARIETLESPKTCPAITSARPVRAGED